MEIFTTIGIIVVFLAAIFAVGHVLSGIGDVVGPRFDDWMERRRKASITDEVIANAVHVAYKNGPYGVFFQPSYTSKKGKVQNAAYWGFYDRDGVLYSFESEEQADEAALKASKA
jgi:hypothetical protein